MPAAKPAAKTAAKPAVRRTRPTRPARATVEVANESKWSKLVREAKKGLVTLDPYLFDACDPPVLITAPIGLERSMALAQLSEADRDDSASTLIPMIEALVGAEVFPQVWLAIRDEPIEVTLAFIDDIAEHFNAGADEGAEDFPGGESAS
ncbi:hypothetical protein OG563_26420 [Nocardia vinacea]|uniref:Tail assembly chaperone n=1 Tax=Nocardia vinacea TaxID=96468 RepID=A0ABZ1YHU6_9NOCA|nr:hypothetical protein [Nocardia vinacea]